MIRHVLDRIAGKVPRGKKRSSDWPSVRREHLKNNPRCAVCHGTKKLEVHHIKPFHTHPELELHHSNLITLCQRKKYGLNCHLAVGHGGNFRGVNVFCPNDALVWEHRIGASRKYVKEMAKADSCKGISKYGEVDL